LNRRRRRR